MSGAARVLQGQQSSVVGNHCDSNSGESAGDCMGSAAISVPMGEVRGWLKKGGTPTWKSSVRFHSARMASICNFLRSATPASPSAASPAAHTHLEELGAIQLRPPDADVQLGAVLAGASVGLQLLGRMVCALRGQTCAVWRQMWLVEREAGLARRLLSCRNSKYSCQHLQHPLPKAAPAESSNGGWSFAPLVPLRLFALPVP